MKVPPFPSKRVTPFAVFLTITFFFLSASSLIAQGTHIVKGVITDEKKNPLQGVSVAVKGNDKSGTSTNAKGEFSITVPDATTTLVCSFVGMEPKQVDIKGKISVAVTMTSTNSAMSEVLVIGVQRQSRHTTTTAVSTLSGAQIENSPVASVDMMLQGRIAGLNVQLGSGEPGVAPTVVVRGNSTVNTNIGDPDVASSGAMSQPLYVIDGIPVNPSDMQGALGATGTNFLAGLNMNDIESIQVQKDAAATAAWGSLGANGVIYITTKQGRAKKPQFRVNLYGGASLTPQLMNTYTGQTERNKKLSIINDYISTATPSQVTGIPIELTDSLNPYFNYATDWQGLFYRMGNVKNADLNLSGGTDNIRYNVSGNYYNEKGIIQAFGFQRYSFKTNLNITISPKLNSQVMLSMSKSDRQRGTKYNSNSDLAMPIGGSDGSSTPASFWGLNAFDSAGYLGLYNMIRNTNINDMYMASLALNYNIFRDLRFSTMGSANISVTNRDYFEPSNLNVVQQQNAGTLQPSQAYSDKNNYSTYFITNTLDYNKRFMSGFHTHSLGLTVGQQFKSNVLNTTSISAQYLPNDDIQVITSAAPKQYLNATTNYTQDAMLSFVGQLSYNFDRRYLLYASYRADASSRFGPNSKWGYFPSIGLGWNVTDEKFMQRLNIGKTLSLLKFRASWGISGTQSPNPYAPFNSYTTPGTYNGKAAVVPDYNNGLTKNNLTWTSSTQRNLGIDLEMFDSRLSVTADIYERLSNNSYYNFTLPYYMGYNSITFNAADLVVSNRGVDLSINAVPLSRTSKVRWNTSFTMTFNRNMLTKLPNGNKTFVPSSGDPYGTSRIFSVGQPIYEMFQMRYKGVYNKASDIPFDSYTGKTVTYFKGNHTVVPGDPIWEDVHHIGDVWVDESDGGYGSRMPTGDPNPRFVGGFTNDFAYKNFSLTIQCVYTYKRTIVDNFRSAQFARIAGSTLGLAQYRLPDLSGVNYWTPTKAQDPNYKADFPSINPFVSTYYQFSPFSTMFNTDGSYFKISTISLGYRLPPTNRIVKKLFMRDIRFYSLVNNVYTFTKSSVPNPELVNQLGNYVGGAYPMPVKITFGIDATF